MKKYLLLLLLIATFGFLGFSNSIWAISNQKQEDIMKNFTTIYRPQMFVIGIECRTSNDPNAGPFDIPQLWQKFYSQDILNQIPNKISQDIIALYCDYDGDHTQPYSCVIGCMVSTLENIPFGMVGKVIPASTFAVYQAQGSFPKSLIDTWAIIWQSPIERTFTGDYEVYEPTFSTDSHKKVDVFIAIEDN